MHIVIGVVHLGMDKVHPAPMHVTKKWTMAVAATLGVWKCCTRLQFECQIAICDQQDANCHRQGTPCKYALPDCTLSMTICTLLGVCTLSVTCKIQHDYKRIWHCSNIHHSGKLNMSSNHYHWWVYCLHQYPDHGTAFQSSNWLHEGDCPDSWHLDLNWMLS